MDTTSASSIHKKTSFYARFTPVCFNAPLTKTALINLRPVIFGLTLFDWFISFYLFLIKIRVFNYDLFIYTHVCQEQWRTEGGGLGVQTPPPQKKNSEDIGGVLDRMSKKNRHLDFLL